MAMKGKILLFDNSIERKISVAEKKAEQGEFEKTLSLLFSIENYDKNASVLMDIADAYADMGLLELSNTYWFKYLDVASKDKQSVAFEELAINYFYLEDFWASSYYFHKKIDADGFISKEGIDQEILDFFAGEEHKKAFYHIAYPFDRADYSGKIKMAKHFIATGKFSEAIKVLTLIPKECMNDDGYGYLATAYYMNDELDNSAMVSRESLSVHGDNVTAYCNLCVVYDMKEDSEKSEYYYQEALKCRTGERTEAYKIVTCAIELDDHVTTKECLIKILADRQFDVNMRFYYGLACINLGEYDLAEKEFQRAYRININDVVVKYYCDLVSKLKNGCKNSQNLLPLRYVREVPKKEEKHREKLIKKLAEHTENISSAIKQPSVRQILLWGLRCREIETARQTAFVLASSFNPFSKKAMKDVLLDSEALPELKRLVVFALTVRGYNKSYGVVAGSVYIKVKPKKISFAEHDENGMFEKAYALATSRVVFWGFDKLDKLVVSAEKIFKKLNGVVTNSDVTIDEIASLMVYKSEFEKLKSKQLVAQLFDVKIDRFNALLVNLLGEKKDENN